MCPCFEEDVRCSGRVVACGVVSMCHEHVLCRSYACVGAPTVFCGHGRVVSKAQSPWSGRPAKATRLDRAAASALEESQKVARQGQKVARQGVAPKEQRRNQACMPGLRLRKQEFGADAAAPGVQAASHGMGVA